jgi:regulator of sigma E protease
MEIIIKILQFILSISILVILHEFGHFIFAKIFKTRVEKFYLFFNPWFSIFKFRRGDTEYGLGWLPIGGYVKISGMIDESMDKEQLKQPPQPYEFRSKKAWQRLIIMIGGVVFNFIAALVIYSMVLYTWGEEYLPTNNVKYGIAADTLAQKIGLQNGDKIISVDNREIENFLKIIPEIILSSAKTIQVERNDSIVNINLPDSLIHILIKSRKLGFIAPRIPFVIDGFTKESVAEKAGLMKNDSIIMLNDEKIAFFDEFKAQLSKYKNQNVKVTAIRNKKDTIHINVNVPESGLIGLYPVGDISRFFELKKIKYSFLKSIPAGIVKGYETSIDYLKQFKLIFNFKTKAYESLGSFITIGSIFPGSWDWHSFWNLTAFLSIILAIMNILPIPALDGGHVLFVLFEIITGRKPGDKFLEYAQIIGMILLLALFIFATYNDILRLF